MLHYRPKKKLLAGRHFKIEFKKGTKAVKPALLGAARDMPKCPLERP
jgi:hypothetical protein